LAQIILIFSLEIARITAFHNWCVTSKVFHQKSSGKNAETESKESYGEINFGAAVIFMRQLEGSPVRRYSFILNDNRESIG